MSKLIEIIQNNPTVTVSFKKRQFKNSNDQPIRSDVLTLFNSDINGENVKVTGVSAFIDTVRIPVPVSNRLFIPRVVITNIAGSLSDASNMEMVLLAIATSMSLRDDNNWIQAFRPTPGSEKEIDITDIGALNIESNLERNLSGYGERIDTKSDDFKLSDLSELVALQILPGLIFSMDCPDKDLGPLSIFSAAATGIGSNAAYKVIYDATNQLTNGAFSKHFPFGSAIFTDTNNRVHNGTWTDKNGVKRDLRDIDHLAVCNLIGAYDVIATNGKRLMNWSNTFLQTDVPLEERLEERKKMIIMLTNKTAKFTGFSQRVTFTADFMDALARGIKETGLAIQVKTD